MGKKHKGHSWKQPCHGVLPASLSQSELDGVCDQKVRNYIVKVANPQWDFQLHLLELQTLLGEGLGLA